MRNPIRNRGRVHSRNIAGRRAKFGLALAFIFGLLPTSQAASSPWSARVNLPLYQQADFDDLDAALELERIGVGFNYRIAQGRTSLSLGLASENSRYRAGQPIFGAENSADVSEIALGATYTRPGPQLTWFASVKLMDSVSGGVDFGEGGHIDLSIGLLHPLSRKLTIGLLATARTLIEDDVEIGLLPLIEYRISEHSRIGLVRSVHPAFGYSQTLDDRSVLYLVLHNATRQFRYDDNAAVVDRERGLRIGGWWRSESGLTTEAYAGMVGRRLDFYADDADTSGRVVDATVFYGLAAKINF